MTGRADYTRPRVAYFVMRYPLLTQTFIDREMRGVMANGVDVEVHPVWDFGNRVVPLPGGPGVIRTGLLRTLGSAALETLRRPALVGRGIRAVLRHRPRSAEGWFMCIWGGIFALGKAWEFRTAPVSWFHGAWATAPATVAMSLAQICGRPFSFGAHAYDLYRHGGDALLPLKVRHARFVHTTTAANVDSLRTRFPGAAAEILLARRGLPALPVLRDQNDGWNERPIRLLSVGRLVEKKGQRYQLALVAELRRRGVPAELRIIGEGPLRTDLEREAGELGVTVDLAGALSQDEVQASYGCADVFLHTGIVDAEGDRDGLPNVVPEAMSRGVCVISSPGGGAAEAISHDVTGLIAEPSDATALADAVGRLRGDAALRVALRRAAHAWVAEHFLAARNTAALARRFGAGAGGG